MDPHPALRALPMQLRWDRAPLEWHGDGDAALTITAAPRTDLFIDPEGVAEPALNAPRLLGRVDGDFMLSARVRVPFSATYDAGVLLLYAHERAWAKLCFERSPQGHPMVVSVVTRGVSDDANAFTVENDEIWLRVSRLGAAFAFHASTDGTTWSLIRHFALDASTVPNRADDDPAGPRPRTNTAIEVGFEAQSPTGNGCSATFEHISFKRKRLTDLRSGE